MFWTCLPAGRYKEYKKILPARHLPARALQWQAGRSRSGEAGGLILSILSKKFPDMSGLSSEDKREANECWPLF